ncbi:serine/threonine-protein kinase M1 [Penicillium ochrochloron]
MAGEGDYAQGSVFEDDRPAEPPASSILATHFAPRLATQGHEPQRLSREAFSQLRQELLGEKFTQSRLDEGITDINKLICIILKAGLEASPTSNGPEEDLEGQVLDCLEIIQVSIDKAPQALWDVSDPLILGEDVQAPLFSWLILRLIRVACTWHVEAVQDRVHSIFTSMACLQYKQVRSSPSCYGISAFLRACALDILCSLEGFLDMDLHSFRPFKLSMPSKSGSLMEDLDNLGLPRGLLKRSFTLGSFSRAAALASALLDALSPEASAQGISKRRNCTLRQNLPWALNGYHRLRRVLVRWLQTPGLKVTLADEQILSHFLIYTRRLCVSDSSMATMLSDMSLASTWTQCLAESLPLSISLPMPTIQLDLSHFLDEVTLAIKQSKLAVPQLRDILLPVLTDIRAQDSNPQIVEQCLGTSINSLYTQLLDNTSLALHSVGASSTSPDVDSSVAHQRPRAMDQETEQGQEEMRASKRMCLSADSSDTALVQMLLEELSTLLGCGCAANLTDLCAAVQNLYEGASEPQRTQFLQVLGKLPCAVVGTLVRKPSGLITSDTLFCERCDSDQHELGSIPEGDIAGYEDLWTILKFVLPRLSRTPGPRIAAMVALRRILVHSPNLNHMHLSSSTPGEFCLHSLRSSIRELRVATGHSVVAFVRPNLQPDVRRANFVIVLEWLRNLSEKDDMPLQEACILTLCRLARVSEDDEKNIILLRLLEYLGHPNPYVCAVAYNELSKLAQQFSVTPAGLFRPYWRTLSVAVVKNLQTRPYMAEQLCELLGMKVDGFLRLTEVHVLPYLVLTRKRDIICRIGASRNEGESPFDVCSEKNNLAAILAFLLAQQSDNPEAMIMSLLAEIDPAFKGRSLAELVRIEPILIACDLLKSLGDAGEQNKERFLQALRRLATFVPRKFLHASSSKKADLLSHFIEEHVLGIITQFANAINDFQVRQTLAEKRRNLKAIEEMINIAQGHVSNALPQVCACLRSALEIEELCDHAFSAWKTLIRSLSEEDIEPLIDQTWAIVIRYWDKLTDESRRQAHQLIDHILTNQPNLVRDTFNTMPSLASIPELAAFETKISELRAEMDVRSRFLALIRRCQSENSTVVEQALKELMPFLSDNEEFLHVSVLSEQPDPVVAHLTRALLDCCVKFSTNSDSITLLSSQCLGLVGCLDPNRVETIKEKKDILVLSNFDRMEETVEFILFFLQHVLVEAFLSASNTRAQGFLAYAMQGLLKICNLNAAVTQRARDLQGDEKYQRWMELPESVRNTLTPFLTSTYTVTVVATNSKAPYPLLSPKITHSEWLRTLVQDLLQTGNGDNAKLIFAVCSRVVKGQDISISSFLFPFAALNRIVGGTEQEQQDLQLELLNVLSHPLPEANNNFRETIISSSQSVFEVLDYLSRWLQGKKKQLNALNLQSYQSSRSHKDATRDSLLDKYASQIKSVEVLLAAIPPEIISKRAVECKSFSRALFHWEQYIRKCKSQTEPQESTSSEQLYERLQDIYSQIDEPDGIEGISSHLSALSIDQQVLEHRKAGRWTTAQSWYELELEKEPDNIDAQWNLITCLKESGQQDAIVTRFEVLKQYESAASRLLPFAVEASWITSRWDKLQGYLELCADNRTGEFNVGIGSALNALREKGTTAFVETINELRLGVAKSLTANSVASLQSCHDDMLRLHALADVEAIVHAGPDESHPPKEFLLRTMNRRLDVLGGYLADKQYLLGLRRAAMELTGGFGNSDISAAWLTSAHLSRKGNFTGQAYHSMLHAARLKDRSATIEHARLLWKDGHHRKAIQTLEGAIASNDSNTTTSSVDSQTASFLSGRGKNQNETAAVLFTILPQVVARICHRNNTVYDLLTRMVTKAVQSFPQQGLWTVLAVVKSSNKDRALKGQACLSKIQDYNNKVKKDTTEIRRMIVQGQKFSDELLQLCLARVEERASKVTLGRNLGFNHKVAPCRLVVPFQAMLIPSLPVIQDSEHLKGFRPFPRDPTTIEAVLDEAQILNSLQKPRKISIRGSDGKIYNALCKPKDDLRKDQRLMEFNNMINRFLKRDVESSKRRMYIKTYAVTPLNEECGIIEWVDNLRTLRDIIVKHLRERRIAPNYTEIRHYLDEICADKTFSKLSLFNTKILAKLPAVLHEWFIEMFPETESWFTARLRYTRSSAVMSMVGYVLGLGDRHGENLLFEEGTGGILHVDFNCLFDKGQTFEKPEVVPFRLTHNMIDAFGAYGYNGPFRRTCEITLGLLRQNEDALMTILETFLHDPTTDFIGKRRRTHVNVPDTPAGVLEDVRNKLRGFMSKQPIPLSVDGQVDELIVQATDKKNLASMYVGWCAFF